MNNSLFYRVVDKTITFIENNAALIENYRFAECAALSEAVFPNCTTIGSYAFLSCYALTTVSFPSCTTIDSYAFQSCRALTTASFPNCTTIGSEAFRYCFALATVSFPNCTAMRTNAFNRCSALTTASFPSCTTIGDYAFSGCSALTTASFPNCTAIEYGAFYGCHDLTTAIFSHQETVQGNFSTSAFLSCTRLLSLYLLASTVYKLSDISVFSSTPISTTGGVRGSIYVPSSLITTYKGSTNWVTYSTRFVGLNEPQISNVEQYGTHITPIWALSYSSAVSYMDPMTNNSVSFIDADLGNEIVFAQDPVNLNYITMATRNESFNPREVYFTISESEADAFEYSEYANGIQDEEHLWKTIIINSVQKDNASASVSVNASFAVTVTFTFSNVTSITVDGQTVSSSGGSVQLYAGMTYSVVATASNNINTPTVTTGTGYSISKVQASAKTFDLTVGTTDGTINVGASCVPAGTLVTMGDGTKKPIENVKQGDIVLTWSLWNGCVEAVPVAITYNHGYAMWKIMTLEFSDGSTVKTINRHGFFDLDINNWANIYPENVKDYIGHRFVKINAQGEKNIVVLEKYYCEAKEIGSYSLLTAYNDNFIADDVLCITGEDDDQLGRFEYFTVGDNMKYDEQLMNKDIGRYGLYEYEQWADYMDEATFNAVNGPYFKVLVGRGVFSEEYIYQIIQDNLYK